MDDSKNEAYLIGVLSLGHRYLFAVHLFTASGAAFAVLAAMAIHSQDWRLAFFWVGVATIVDGIDGPLARRFDVVNRLPRWDGSALDFVIDYTTYVFLPAVLVALACGLEGLSAMIAGSVVAVSGALYFADKGMKQPDNSFKGFPAGWNMAVFFIFVLQPPTTVTLLLVFVLAATSFLPIQFVHPVRVLRWRPLTLGITLLWCLSALYLIATDFAPEVWAKALLTVSSLYLFSVGAVQQVLAKPKL